jgi:hypothetical protein
MTESPELGSSIAKVSGTTEKGTPDQPEFPELKDPVSRKFFEVAVQASMAAHNYNRLAGEQISHSGDVNSQEAATFSSLQLQENAIATRIAMTLDEVHPLKDPADNVDLGSTKDGVPIKNLPTPPGVLWARRITSIATKRIYAKDKPPVKLKTR